MRWSLVVVMVVVGLVTAGTASERTAGLPVLVVPVAAITVGPTVEAGVVALPHPPAEAALPATEPEGAPRAHRAGVVFEDEPAEVVRLNEEQLGLLTALQVRPLTELAPGIAALLEQVGGGSVTAAVVVPSRGTIYVVNPEIAVPLASVVKLVIMLAVLDGAEREGRMVTADEMALLEPMVTWSDNDSATLLWSLLGNGDGIEAYLERIGAGGILPDPWAWGDTRASGAAVALLLSRLAFGDLVNAEHRELALSLLAQVSEDQRWGIGSALLAPDRALVAVKDGWYPVARGWRASSAGVVVPVADAPAGAVPYSIAVLSAENETLEGAIETIQGVAALVDAALQPAFVTTLP
jgi:hypothetical protein